MNCLIFTKIIFLCITILILSSCSQETSQKVENSFSNVNTNSISLNEKEKHFGDRKAEIRKQFKEYIENVSKEFGVSLLEKEKITDGNLEVRIWRFSSFSTQDSVLVLTRFENKWSANLIRRTIKMSDLDKEKPPKKFFRKLLNNPKSDWEKFWQELIKEQILILPSGDEVGNEVCPDCELFLIETNIEGKYRAYDYHSPAYFKEIKEAQQIVKIYDIISNEFDLVDFKPNE